MAQLPSHWEGLPIEDLHNLRNAMEALIEAGMHDWRPPDDEWHVDTLGALFGALESFIPTTTEFAQEPSMGKPAGKVVVVDPELIAEIDPEEAAPISPPIQSAEGLIDPEKEYVGVIKRFKMAVKHGYIECSEIKDACGQDVYVHQNVLAESGANIGYTVRFHIHLNTKGLPQAKSPLEVLESASPGEYWGILKSFDHATGYGFVECEETFAKYNRDVYLPGSKAQGFYKGQCVLFNIDLNEDSMPVIKEMFPSQFEDDKAIEESLIIARYGDGKGKDKGDAKGGKYGKTEKGKKGYDDKGKGKGCTPKGFDKGWGYADPYSCYSIMNGAPACFGKGGKRDWFAAAAAYAGAHWEAAPPVKRVRLI